MMYLETLTSNDLLEFIYPPNNLILVSLFICFVLLIMILFPNLFTGKPSRKVFLLDFSCYKAKESHILTREMVVDRNKRYFNSNEETLLFLGKMLDRAGVGDLAYFPEALVREPPNPCTEEARKEAEAVMFGAVGELLAKTGVKGKEIGILVVNCSLFTPVPSLSAMIVNRFKLGDNVLSYNLGGMGCSAGLSSIGLAKQLLQVHPNTYALVVSTENLTQNCYIGNDRSMVLVNSLFRLGGAAILLSNRSADHQNSKYQLIHTVHTHTASNDRCYKCICQEEDEEGIVGININKDLMIAAIKAIEANVTALARLVLPISEKIKFLTNYIVRYLHVAEIKPYIPRLGNHFDHFFPHVGGKPVLDELQKNLKFSESQMEASKMTLYRFGNTSSSSVWYELAYAEAKGRIKKGDRVWQLAFGSGFKCNSAVWRALKTVDFDEKNPWSEEIDNFPVDVSKIEPLHGHHYFEPSKK